MQSTIHYWEWTSCTGHGCVDPGKAVIRACPLPHGRLPGSRVRKTHRSATSAWPHHHFPTPAAACPQGAEAALRIFGARLLRGKIRVKGALQLLINRYGYIRFAHEHERASTQSFVVLVMGNW